MTGDLNHADRRADTAASPSAAAATTKHALRLVAEALDSIRFGQVILTIHDGAVVQFDKLEKSRLR